MEDVVIISGVRTPIGKFQGSLEPLSAPQLGAIAVREAVKRAKVDPTQVDECIMGIGGGGRSGTESRAPGRVCGGRAREHGGRDDHQQSLRLRIESRGAGRRRPSRPETLRSWWRAAWNR